MSSQSNGFGPWSTSLDNGTRMQLSAFWRQRMAGLARLPLGRRLSRRWAACGIMATLLLAAMPLVELSSGAVADEKPSAAQDAKPKAGEEFVWRFSNGLEVELIGLAKNPSKDDAWWKPDGSPLPDASLPPARYRSVDGGARELAFRWRNVDDNSDQTRLWHTLPPYGGAGGGVSEKEGDSSILEVTGVTFTSGLKASTVTFTASVSSTPWKKAFETDGRSASSTGLMMDGKPLSAAFTTAYETKTGIAITASYGLGDQSGRLVLFDKFGKELLPTRQSGVGSTHFTQTTFEFDGVALAGVDRFELQTQTRTLETVEFHNVSLEAGHMTKVVVEPYEVDRDGVETSYLPIKARVAIAESDGKRIDRLPILGPITSGKEIVFLDPPSDEEVLRVFNKNVAPSFLDQVGLSKKYELPIDQIAKIEKVKFEEKADPPRQYPMIGQARQVHSLYMCELQLKNGKAHKLCVDHNHLHMTPGECEKKKPATSTSTADPLEFGEVVELVINDDQPEIGNFLVDFETGKVLSPPSDVQGGDAVKWAKESGVDAMGEMKSSVQGLMGFDMIVIPTSEANWDPSPGVFAQLDQGTPGTPAVMTGRGNLPVTYHFQTREGARGVLQIVERVGREGVKIRYKLVVDGTKHRDP